MNVFDVETWIDFDNGLSLCFRTPTMQERAWATDVMFKLRDLPVGDPERLRLANEEIPSKLPDLLIDAKLPGGGTMPKDAREQLSELSLLAGDDGIEVLGKVFFRSRIKDPEATGEGQG